MKTQGKPNLTIIKERKLEISGLKLTYTLYNNSMHVNDKSVYSIEVNCLSDLGEDNSFVFDISRSKIRAEEIFRTISDNYVTPCTLVDVLENIL